MNQTIREAIEKIDDEYLNLPYGGAGRAALTRIKRILENRLEAAPQLPVEQSEPLAEHPLHAGIDWSRVVPGEFCYLEMDYSTCPCGGAYPHGVGSCGFEKLATVEIEIRDGKKVPIGLWLAPLAVIEPEPELDEFEQWVATQKAVCYMSNDAINWIDNTLAEYRRIRSRKGDK